MPRIPPTAAAAVAALAAALGFGATLAPAQETAPALPEDWSAFDHINSLVIADEESPLYGLHHFYIGETGRDVFLQQQGFPYPEGTTFVGAVYDVVSEGAQHDEGAPAMITLMVKDPAAEETGGWRFAAYRPDGTLIEQDVAQTCFQCHTQVEETDFVFSRPLGLVVSRP